MGDLETNIFEYVYFIIIFKIFLRNLFVELHIEG